ncbi:MAG: DUF2157 domain-containing protein [Psychrobacter sp.]|nr:DUF2157 domain-containing protein [Psychrobacter sp.]
MQSAPHPKRQSSLDQISRSTNSSSQYLTPNETLDALIHDGILPINHADDASQVLGIYPNQRSWLAFFDKALLITSLVAIGLALVFFIAYNWFHMGKMGKFALVEGALVLTVLAYMVLAYRRKYTLLQQLLLLVASIIVGSLLALFGQVYQTGADTWQLFFNWSLLILPFVLIARLPALWLLWLALVNTTAKLYFLVIGVGLDSFGFSRLFDSWAYDDFIYYILTSAVTMSALILWLKFLGRRTSRQISHHWSTYIVALMATYYVTRLADFPINHSADMITTIVAMVLWFSWASFMYLRFYRSSVDILMLTYLCVSAISVVMLWVGDTLLKNYDPIGFLLMGLLLIGMSSGAVVWLRSVNRRDKSDSRSDKPDNHLADKGAGHVH